MADKLFSLVGSSSNGSDVVMVDEDGNKIGGLLDMTIFVNYNEIIQANVTLRPRDLNLQVSVNEVTMMCPFCDMEMTHPCHEIRNGVSQK